MAELFERPNKKSEEVRRQEEKENEYLKTIGEQKVELDYLKKSTGNYTEWSLLRGFIRPYIEHKLAVRAARNLKKPVLLQTALKSG